MPKPRTHRLGELQLRIMKILWADPQATVGTVHEALGGADAFAYTTIATMLRKMEVRGLVRHRAEGRSFLYRAAVDEARVGGSMVNHVVDRMFEGSLADAVAHLLDSRDISRAELAQIEKLIAERRKSL